ncbi:MAG: 50S ribosomal protein L19 [Candidatus Moranbacteria bacterium]|nr:50S ribosomal protein L19 [Candidatus Moranbacteria bacterium]
MDKKIIEFNKTERGDKKMDFQAGDVVKVSLRIKEGGKERIQNFEGLVIAVKGGQSSSPKITVRKVSNGVGVEMIIPILSKNVEKIELIKRAKVRRAKLYYVRGLTTKQSRMKYKDLSKYAATEEEEVKEEEKEEAAEEKAVEAKAPSEEKKAAPKKAAAKKKAE